MLADSLVVTTVAVSDLERSKRFYAERLGLPVLDEQPFAIRFGAGHGSQISVRPRAAERGPDRRPLRGRRYRRPKSRL